ncbi:MAG: hypothetical protein WDZ77_00285 [Candidatus Pacearchaeota archaeon]
MEKRGQVTIFIIIAIVVVSLGGLAYFVFPQIQTNISGEDNNPVSFIENCLEEDLEETIESVSLQGGKLEPVNSFLYEDVEIEYLCYIWESYQPCVVQNPLLRQSVEGEIKKGIETKVESCFAEMKNNFESQGYSVQYQPGGLDVTLLPQRIVTSMNKDLTLSRDETETYEKIEIVVNNNLYELVGIAGSIIESESKYGNAETTIYMDYYKNLKVEKHTQEGGTKIYILTNRDGGEKFQFASRSIVFPPGI